MARRITRAAASRTGRSAPPPPNAAEMHRAWLELVDTDGPFLAIPPLKRVWPQGIPALAEDRKAALSDARRDFENAWEKLDADPANEAALDTYRTVRDGWVQTVLRDVAGWAETLQWGEVPGVQAHSPNRQVVVGAQAALIGPDGAGALVHVVDPVVTLRQIPNDLWAATPVDRMEALLREAKVEIGVVTDGRWWGLVCARNNAMAASGVVDALTWTEEPRTRDAFLTVLGRQYLIGGDPAERLPVLFADSVAAAEEITEALGAQVRLAVELLVQSFSESAAETRRRGLPDPLPERTHDAYEAAVTVMMRIVFLLFAEERGLLPEGELFEQGYGISRELDRLEAASEFGSHEELLDATSLAWHRLLATSRALHGGASFENMRMPAYGGSLFDPDRFAFLTATTEHGTLAITVSDRVMVHALRSVQLAVLKNGDARRISFRDIDVEQIGYIYEGLLGYTAVRVDEPYLGLAGTRGEEPEIPLAHLEQLASAHTEPRKLAAALRTWIENDQPSAKAQSEAAIAKGIAAAPDPNAVSALAQAVGDDTDLRERALPWLGAMRMDLRKRPFVVLPGGLLVKETPSRKNAGAHYTPKSLAKEVVLHALQPLCYSPGPHQTGDETQWKLRSSEEILALKVADIACGSGAFLVAAAEYLAERVVEAWTAEDPANAARKDLHGRAIRQVVAGCLYGADINAMAVEMCKLSLWLVSLDRDLPFSFVDDKVFCGNSLLGLTDQEQLRRLHIDPTARTEMAQYYAYDVDGDATLRRAGDLRRRLLSEVDDQDPARSGAAKRRQLHDLQRVTADLRRIADGVVAAGLALGGKPGRALDEAYQNLRLAIRAAYPEDGIPDPSFLDSIIDAGLTPTVATDYERWAPLHWVLEAPDVIVDHGGFDGVIGNPPFLGGSKLSGALGIDFRNWLMNRVADGKSGNADLVAYFCLRAQGLLRNGGTLGLIATNTVAQGDTREVGLDQLVARGFEIMRSVQSRAWPSSSANLEYAAIWGTTGVLEPAGPRFADGEPARRISTLLEAVGVTASHPVRLQENAGIAYKGCFLLGAGYILSPEEARAWLQRDQRLTAVLFPYLGGADLNSRPDHAATRWAIDFNDMSEQQAKSYSVPFQRLWEQVRPERQRRKPDGRYVLREPMPTRWWQYAEKRPGMRRAIAHFDQVLVMAQVSNTLMPVRVAARQVLDQKLVVFATDSWADLAVLSSSAKQLWSIKYSATMRKDISYNSSDAFETFPRPRSSPELDRIGRVISEERQAIMLRRELGLTKLYNLVHDQSVKDVDDPDVMRLRELHVELDREVMNAYGWADIELSHGFYTYRQLDRWTVSPRARIEILDRLLEENQRRAAVGGAPAGRPAALARGQQDLFTPDAN